METEQATIEQQLLREAQKQTKALQSIQLIAIIWTVVAIFGAIVWVLISLSAAPA
jgi:hypothetical protein